MPRRHRRRGILSFEHIRDDYSPTCGQSFFRQRGFPDDIPNALAQAPEVVVSSGGSCIISPLGEVLAGPAREGEHILFADIDPDEIARGKFDLGVAGHYA
jgi:nitrilase